MIGDCDQCGHSVVYHLPLAGCIKCDCDEFSAFTVLAFFKPQKVRLSSKSCRLSPWARSSTLIVPKRIKLGRS
jgi:hypothetical protein